MTATIAPADLDGVVRRADDRWARRQGDEPNSPDYLKHLCDAVRPLLGQPPAGPVDDVQVRQLLADKQRLTDLVDELRKQAESRGGVIDRQVREIAALKKDLEAADEDARRRVDAAVGAVTADGKQALQEADRLRQALVLRTTEFEQLQSDNAALAEQLAAAQQPARHQHQYVVAAPGTEPQPCQCGQPYPRTAIVTEAVKPSPPEPWAELFGQIRAEARTAGWKS